MGDTEVMIMVAKRKRFALIVGRLIVPLFVFAHIVVSPSHQNMLLRKSLIVLSLKKTQVATL